ncbi:hypothetical protein AgCh_015207 [Apium graveolens]
MNWEVDGKQMMIWDCGPDEANDHVKAVDEARRLAESLESLSLNKDSEENALARKAHEVLQTAMTRLEKELKHILFQNKQSVEFRSSEEDTLDDVSIISFGDDSVDDELQRDSVSRGAEEYIINLIHRDVIPDLRCIVNLMFDSKYGRECSQAFISVRKDALDDCLFILEVEKFSIDDILRMEWGTCNSKIRRWIQAIKIFVRVYLASEKWLVDQVFGELESVSAICFAESSKASMMQLLNFAEAIAVSPHQPEKLHRIFDMYEVLADLIPDIDTLYSDETGLNIKSECQDVLKRLGDCAKATFLDFKSAVASNVSTSAFAGGGIHHLTRYVMNYLRTLTDYSNSLSSLLRDNDTDDPASSSPDSNQATEEDNSVNSPHYLSPIAVHFRSLTSILERNLIDNSKLYKDNSLGCLFLMNNIHYMAEKAKNSELRTILGDDWICKHNWKFQHHAMDYERGTWSSILSLLKDEGLYNSRSNSISKTLLKERLQSFNLAFEDVYKNQTGWTIPDIQLRDDLRISTSLKVIQAYRTFVGRHTNHISDKHIKYTADDLENHLMDLFEGFPRSLQHSFHRK